MQTLTVGAVPRDVARGLAAAISAAIFGFMGLIAGALALALPLAVGLVDRGVAPASQVDLSTIDAIRPVLVPVVAATVAFAAANVVAAVGVVLDSPSGRRVAAGVVAVAVVSLAWTITPPIAGFGVAGRIFHGTDGPAIVAVAVALYAVALLAAVRSSRRS